MAQLVDAKFPNLLKLFEDTGYALAMFHENTAGGISVMFHWNEVDNCHWGGITLYDNISKKWTEMTEEEIVNKAKMICGVG